jgi:hypothetical protein
MQDISKASEERPTTTLKNACLCSKYSHIDLEEKNTKKMII